MVTRRTFKHHTCWTQGQDSNRVFGNVRQQFYLETRRRRSTVAVLWNIATSSQHNNKNISLSSSWHGIMDTLSKLLVMQTSPYLHWRHHGRVCGLFTSCFCGFKFIFMAWIHLKSVSGPIVEVDGIKYIGHSTVSHISSSWAWSAVISFHHHIKLLTYG